MTKQLWINLPVKDVKRSKEFFTKLGFSFDTQYGNTDVSAGMLVGDKKIVVMLFVEHVFNTFIHTNATDTRLTNEVLFSIDAESKEEVDDWAKKVEHAGGNVFSQPADTRGWMYGCAFTDLDGHRWNVLHMDFSKMPK